jgi:uncharacterized tellurite resistance protein B-like protein
MAAFLLLLLVVAVVVWATARSGGTERSTAGGSSSAAPKRSRKAKRRTPESSSNESDVTISVELRSEAGRRGHFSEEDAYEQSKNAWVPPGESVTVAGQDIAGGMIYVGSEMQSPRRYGRSADPALIDPQLEARAKRLDRSGQHLDYWPAYADIPRSSRAAYLDWLATGRRDPGAAVGYVFLFFYGLERRILLDMEQSDDPQGDLAPILEEIEALRAVYAEENRSFDGYSQRLLDFARLKCRDGVPGPDAAPSSSRGLGLADKTALGTFLKDSTPLPAAWALAWLRGNPHHHLNTPGTRCRDAFDQLFTERYEARHEGGLVVEESGPPLQATYRPASSAFRETRSVPLGEVVDVGHCSFPEPLARLADKVEDDLDAYSRWIGRRDDRSSPAAIGQLPAALVKGHADDDAKALAGEIEDKLGDDDYAVVPSDWITGRWPSKNEGRLTKVEAQGLSGFLAGFGYGVEPDVRFTRNPSKRDHVTLFRLSGAVEEEPPGEAFEAARLLLHLASAVAGADDDIADSEKRHIEAHLEDALDLTEAERRRLRAHLERRLAHPPTLRGVRRRAKTLSEKERRQLATYLLTVAGADGQIQREELNVLEKIYDTLGLESGQVHQDLHRLSSRAPGDTGGDTTGEAADEGPVTVIETSEKKEAGAYAIPAEEDEEPAGAKQDEGEGLSLDLDRVKDVQDETRDVAQVLGDVFEEEEEEDEVEEVFSLDGLSEEREAFIDQLRARPSWPRGDFERVAEEHGLMPGFAVEGINDAAFDAAGEPLLEGEDPIEVNPHALEALQS